MEEFANTDNEKPDTKLVSGLYILGLEPLYINMVFRSITLVCQNKHVIYL